MRPLATIFLTGIVTFSALVRAADAPQTDVQRKAIELEMCKATICQKNLHVTMTESDGSTYDHVFDVFPGIIQEAGILVVAGQTVNIEADVNGENLVNLHAVDVITNPSKTIVAHLEQVKGVGMMLSVRNPFKSAIKFNMGIMPLASDDLKATSSCPVIAGGGSFETWGFPILQVLLGEPHFLSPTDPTTCD